MKSWKAMVGLALASTAFFFQRAVFSHEIFITRDIERVYYPLRQYWAARVSSGQFPDWYPYDGLGQPFAAMVISGAFHPSNLLYLLLPLGAALKWNELACFPVMFLGIYLLAGRWNLGRWPSILAAILFCFSGYGVSITNNLLYLMAMATFPWVLWAAKGLIRAPSVHAGLSTSVLLALLLFTGDSQSFVICSGLVVVMAASCQRPWPALAAAVAALVGAACLSAVQLIPSIALANVVGISDQPLSLVLSWSMHPLRLIDLALGPVFHGGQTSLLSADINQGLLKMGQNTMWVDSLYVGLPALVLVACAAAAGARSKQFWCAAGVALVLFVLILGRFGGLYAMIFRAVPLWRPFRYPEKIFPYLLLLVALGAGAGLQVLEQNLRNRRRAALGAVALAALSAGLFVAERAWGFFSQRVAGWAWPEITAEASTRLSASFGRATLASAVFILLVGAAWRWAASAALRGSLTALTCFAQLFFANESLYALTYPDLLRVPTGFVRQVLAREGPPGLGRYRVFGGVDLRNLVDEAGFDEIDSSAVAGVTALDAVTPALWGIEGADSYLPAVSRRVRSLTLDIPLWFMRLLGTFNTRYATVSESFFEKTHGAPALVIDRHPSFGLLLLRIPGARPRAYLSRPRCVDSVVKARSLLASSDLNLADETVVECSRPLTVAPAPAGPGTAEIVRDEPEQLEVDVDASVPELLVVSDAFYPGWKASVDGSPVEILPANVAGRAVPVESGRHRVVFRYRTPFLVGSALVSGGSWFIALAWAAGRTWRRLQKAPPVLPGTTVPAAGA